MSGDQSTAVARLAASLLLAYPDEDLLGRLDMVADVVEQLPARTRDPLTAFLGHVADTPVRELQEHYVSIFDMKRKACPYLTYWTAGETRNRGMAILRFKQAYADAGFEISGAELPDHLAVVLEFAAVGDSLSGDALLAEHRGPINLLRDALGTMGSAYVHVLDAVVATLPAVTPKIAERMAQLAASGPPVEEVGMEPYGVAGSKLLEIGVRR